MCEDKDAVVLVIDDNADNLFLLDLLLTSDGYRVETACCGREGILKVHQLVPDLIVLDMMMPDMTGFEVIDSVKAHQHLSHIPILLCTANVYINGHNFAEAIKVCHKPFDIDDMITQVHSLIACCNNAESPTFVIDVDNSDPLYSEYQQLMSNYNDEQLTLNALQTEGYEIVIR